MKRRTSKGDEVMNLVITPLGGLSTEEVLSYDPLIDLIRKEVPRGIERAIKKTQVQATIVEINHSGYFIEIPTRFWRNALTACMEHYTEQEDYAKCIYIRSVIDKVTEYEKIPETEKQKKRKVSKK